MEISRLRHKLEQNCSVSFEANLTKVGNTGVTYLCGWLAS